MKDLRFCNAVFCAFLSFIIYYDCVVVTRPLLRDGGMVRDHRVWKPGNFLGPEPEVVESLKSKQHRESVARQCRKG